MPYRKPKNWIILAIVLASLAVALFGIVTYLNTEFVRRSETRVAHSYEVREETLALFSSIKDMEAGQRGYLLTGDSAYLQTYATGRDHVEREFASLQKLTKGDAGQHARLQTLQALFVEKQAVLEESIELRRGAAQPTEADKALQIVATGRGKEVMDEMRTVVDEILDEESRLRDDREKKAESRAADSERYIVAGNVLALTLFLLTGIVAHIDRRKRDQAEAQMRSSEAEFAAIFNTAHDGIIMFTENLRVRLMNPAAARLYVCDADAVVGRSLVQFIPDRLQAAVTNDIQDFMESDESVRLFADRVALHSDGSEFPCAGSYTKTLVSGKRFGTMRFRDLSESKAHQAKIREQSAMLNQVRDAILLCDMNDRIIFWNRGSESLYGLSDEQAVGQNVADVLFASHRELWEAGRHLVLEQGEYSTEVQQEVQHGREIVIEHRRSLIRDEYGQPAAQLVISLDVTARKQAEAKQRRSQRLESIGTLAGGIAHDLNNVLTPILMSARMIQRGSSSERLANTIVTSTERGAQMIKKLLAFAGGEQGVREWIDVRDTVLEAAEILGHTLPKTIVLRVDCSDKLHAVSGDATELSQVIMNLAINSRDAMPDGGRLELKAENFPVDPARAARSDVLRAGPHVLLTVADTGCGIPPHIVERIFDPFFTTKEQGKGTGLGLATTLGIIRAHGGDVTVYSEPDQGTSFSIYLPAATTPEERASVPPLGDEDHAGHGEMILLVDDEPLILETARATLETSGYRVATVGNGSDALDLYRYQGDSIDLVLLDMMMPGMDGFALKDALRSIDPHVRIIATSGLRRPGAEGGRLADVDGFLAKPYSDHQLLRMLRKVFDVAAAPDGKVGGEKVTTNQELN